MTVLQELTRNVDHRCHVGHASLITCNYRRRLQLVNVSCQTAPASCYQSVFTCA